MRAAICARVSSDKQREDETIESQLRDLPAFAERMGWTIGGTYTDDGESAKSGNLAARTNFTRLLADVAAGRFDVVVVASIDRLTRSEDLTERGAILGAFQRGGCKIATPSGQMLDLATTSGDLMATMQAFAAADWLRLHRARVKAGKLTAIARGRKPSGPTPYGYRYDRTTHTWSIDEAQASIVGEIFARVGRGETCHDIAIDFRARGVVRPRGGHWMPESVWQITKKRTYLGEWTAHRQRRLTIAVPPIVTQAAFDLAAASLARHRRRGLDRTSHVYLLDGNRAVCGRCGARIGIASAVEPRTAHPRGSRRLPVPSRYVCCVRRRSNLRATPTEVCGLPYHATADVDAALWDAVIDVATSPEIVEGTIRSLRDAPVVDPRVELDRCKAEVARLERAEATVLDRHARGVVTDAGLDAHLARLATARAEARASLLAAERVAAGSRLALAATDGLAENLARFRDIAERMEPTDRRDLIRMLVPHAEIGDRALFATVHLPAELLGLPAPNGLASLSGYKTPACSLPLRSRVAVALPARRRAA